MSSLSENSDLNSTPTSLDLMFKLLKLQKHVFLYSVESFKMMNELPNLMNDRSFKINHVSIDINDLIQRQVILEKYYDRVHALTKFSELHQIYEKINEFTKPTLINLLSEIKDLKKFYNNLIHDSEDDMLNTKTSDSHDIKNNIKHFLIQYLFPNLIIEEAIYFILSQTDLSECDNNELLVLSKFDNFPDVDELSKSNIKVLDPAIKSYLKLFDINRSDELYCLYQSLKKELLFDPEKFDTHYHDSSINDDSIENEDSSDDVESTKYKIIHNITEQLNNVSKVSPILILLIKTTHFKLKYYKPDIPIISDEKFELLLKVFEVLIEKIDDHTTFLKSEEAEAVIDEEEDADNTSLTNTIKLLTLFSKQLTEYLSTQEDLQTLMKLKNSELITIAFKEQYHLIDKLQKYNQSLIEFLAFSQAGNIDTILTETNYDILDQFTELDRSLKEAFLFVFYFEFRFKYEVRILDQLIPTWQVTDPDQ